VLSFYNVSGARAAVDDSVADENFAVEWAEGSAGSGTSRPKGGIDTSLDVLDDATYQPPRHADTIDGCVVPQSPADLSLDAHLRYEADVLSLLRSR
jgi:hypothetical protein